MKGRYEIQLASIGIRMVVLIRIPEVTDKQIFHQKLAALKCCMLNNKHQGEKIS